MNDAFLIALYLFLKLLLNSYMSVHILISGEAKDDLSLEWQALSKRIHKLKEQLSKPQGSFVFNFVEVSIFYLWYFVTGQH